MSARRPSPTGDAWARIAIGVPAAWLGAFLALPMLIVAAISLTEAAIGQPPFVPLIVRLDDGHIDVNVQLGNYRGLIDDDLYVVAGWTSLRLAAIATAVGLLVGYPLALAIDRSPRRWKFVLSMLVIMPFWTSFLVRVYAWIGLLRPTGAINGALMALGAIERPLPLLHTEAAVVIGMVYSYLPFMVLPILANLDKQDRSLMEAAADLGARPWRSFLAVTLPLSLPGVAAGCLLVFVPSVGEFLIPELLGGPGSPMLGKVLWTEFFGNRDWPLAAALTVALMALLVAPIAWLQRLRDAA
jgi:putrescine transport system permease protein